MVRVKTHGYVFFGLLAGLMGGRVFAEEAAASLPPGLSQPTEVQPAQAQSAEAQAAAPSTQVAEAAQAAPAEVASAPAAPTVALSDGSALTLKDGDFIINPPKGWEVLTQRPDLTLMAQPPMHPELKYQRNLQVMSFAGPRYIDAVTAKEFEEKIPQRFSQLSQSVSDFRVRNQVPVELNDGRKGLLFYTEFQMDRVNLMQAHILVSSATRHYLITFTDVAEHFEGDGANQYLGEAWGSMVSAKLGTPTPERFAGLASVVAGVGGAIVSVLAFVWWRKRRAGQQFRDYAEQTDFSGHGVTQAPTSEFASQISQVSSISAVSQVASAHANRKKSKGGKQEVSAPASSMAASLMPSAVSSVAVSEVSRPMSGFSDFSKIKVASQTASVLEFSSHSAVSKADKKAKKAAKRDPAEDEDELSDDDLVV